MNQAQKIFIDYRKRTGLTQEEIANAFGISQGTVSLIENGERTPNSTIILKILGKTKKVKSA